jgi:hypothetical protein
VISLARSLEMRGAVPLVLAFVALPALLACGREPSSGADAWLTNAVPLSGRFATLILSTNRFADLHAEAVAGKLRVTCRDTNVRAMTLVASADPSGHWPARDWQSFRMQSNAVTWFAELPVESLHVPLVYFVMTEQGNRFLGSRMRIVDPLGMGLEEPTHFFWPFLEGFELNLDGWRVDEKAEVRTNPAARNGRAALLARVPAGRRATTIATTRVRGWVVEEQGATGVGLWLRTKSGTGVAAFTLLAHAFSANQIAVRRVEAVKVSDRWSRIELPFSSFPGLPLADLDLFSIELSGPPGTEFLLDDFYLIGHWRMDF